MAPRIVGFALVSSLVLGGVVATLHAPESDDSRVACRVRLDVHVKTPSAVHDAPVVVESKASDRGQIDAINIGGIAALLVVAFGAAAGVGPFARGREG